MDSIQSVEGERKKLKDAELRWINSGVKNYATYKDLNETKVITDSDNEVDINKVFVKTEKQVHPRLKGWIKRSEKLDMDR